MEPGSEEKTLSGLSLDEWGDASWQRGTTVNFGESGCLLRISLGYTDEDKIVTKIKFHYNEFDQEYCDTLENTA